MEEEWGLSDRTYSVQEVKCLRNRSLKSFATIYFRNQDIQHNISHGTIVRPDISM